MNTVTYWTIIEISFYLYLIKKWWRIFTPIVEWDRIDFLWLDQKMNIYKIQVKSSYKTKRWFVFDSRYSKNKWKWKYNKNEIDFFATIQNNKYYLIPVNKLKNKSQVTVRLNKPKKIPKYWNPIYWEDYEI
jgi:hypothetical protein